MNSKAQGAPIVVVGTRADMCQPSLITEVLTRMQEQFSHWRQALPVSALTKRASSTSSKLLLLLVVALQAHKVIAQRAEAPVRHRRLRATLVELVLKQRSMGEQIPQSCLELEGLVQRKR